MSITVRDAVPGDLNFIYDSVYQLAVFEHLDDQFVATREQYAQQLFGANSVAQVLIAEIGNGQAGFALSFETFSTFLGRRGIWLEDLFVVDAHRRKGVARTLLAELTKRTEGRLEWEVLDWNANAIALYESLGATRTTGWSKYRVVRGS